MGNNQKSLSRNLEALVELIQLAKEDNRNHVDEVVENVLRESGFTNLKNEELINSAVKALNLFPVQIEYDENSLLSEKNTTIKKIRKYILMKYFFNLFFTTTSTLILSSGLFILMSPLVKKAMAGALKPNNTPEIYNIGYAILAFWIIGSWYLSTYLFNRFSKVKIDNKQSKVDIILNASLFILFVFVALFLPGYQQLFTEFARSNNESATVYVLFKIFFSTEFLGVLILPSWIYVSLLTFLKLKERT